MRRIIIFVAAMVALMSVPRAARADLAISAAISLRGALEKARPELEKAAGEPVAFSFGASGTLASQIQQGAPIDLFISADRANVTRLTMARAADPATVMVIAGNQLVLIAPATPRAGAAVLKGFGDLLTVGKVAVGEPKVVPAGAYAKEALTNLKLWDALARSGKIVTGENVAAVLTYVQRGEVDAGLVYATDARGSRDVTVVATADPKLHAPIEYVSVIIGASRRAAAAGRVQSALSGPAIQAILKDYGFTSPASVPASATAPREPAG